MTTLPPPLSHPGTNGAYNSTNQMWRVFGAVADDNSHNCWWGLWFLVGLVVTFSSGGGMAWSGGWADMREIGTRESQPTRRRWSAVLCDRPSQPEEEPWRYARRELPAVREHVHRCRFVRGSLALAPMGSEPERREPRRRYRTGSTNIAEMTRRSRRAEALEEILMFFIARDRGRSDGRSWKRGGGDDEGDSFGRLSNRCSFSGLPQAAESEDPSRATARCSSATDKRYVPTAVEQWSVEPEALHGGAQSAFVRDRVRDARFRQARVVRALDRRNNGTVHDSNHSRVACGTIRGPGSKLQGIGSVSSPKAARSALARDSV